MTDQTVRRYRYYNNSGMREDIDGGFVDYSDYQALEQRNKVLEHVNLCLATALTLAKDKLVIYRDNADGKYQGGMEYTYLMGIINKAINLYGDLE